MRVLVLASTASHAAACGALIGALGHEAWTGVGAPAAMLLARESRPNAALVALDLDTTALRRVFERLRAASDPALPVVVALPGDSWWLRAPPSHALAPVAFVRREGLTAGALEGALVRLGLAGSRSASAPPIAIDAGARQLSGPAATVRLTPAEGALLMTLLRLPGEVLTHAELARAVWGDPALDRARVVALRTHLYELRRKLDAVGGGGLLVTEPGRGYRLAMP